MAYSSFRKRDMSVEREIAAYLDEHLYSQDIFTRHDRTDNLQDQFAGSDIILSLPSLNLNDIIVDEKAQSQYMLNPLPTFSLELSFLNSRGEWQEGWFLSHKHTTRYYLFCWPKSKVQWNAKKEDIIELEYALVSRVKLQKYFIEKGWTKESLMQKDSQIRQSGKHGQHDKLPNRNFWFYFSNDGKLSERPINIVLRKSVYLALAEYSGIIKS